MIATLIVHGGARALPPEKQPPARAGCLVAVRAGWSVLEAGGSALDAVEAAIRLLEDDPTFNAGFGSSLNAEGSVQMDAGVMEGATFQAGAVAAIAGVRHPISVARRLLTDPPVLLAGSDARRYAAKHGAELCRPEELISPEQRRTWEEQQRTRQPVTDRNDTVGCVARDREGRLACGGSTGGTDASLPGRVGDTPLVGCGFYADDTLGACALTGDGEAIMRRTLARVAMELLRAGLPPDSVARQTVATLRPPVEGEAGIILLNAQGRIGWAHNSSEMACAYRSAEMDAPRVFLRKSEE